MEDWEGPWRGVIYLLVCTQQSWASRARAQETSQDARRGSASGVAEPRAVRTHPTRLGFVAAFGFAQRFWGPSRNPAPHRVGGARRAEAFEWASRRAAFAARTLGGRGRRTWGAPRTRSGSVAVRVASAPSRAIMSRR